MKARHSSKTVECSGIFDLYVKFVIYVKSIDCIAMQNPPISKTLGELKFITGYSGDQKCPFKKKVVKIYQRNFDTITFLKM